MEKIYSDLFPLYDNNGFAYHPYSEFGWLGEMYIQLFLKFQVTFELLFIIIPLNDALNLYKLYHEMNFSKMNDVFTERVKFTYLDNVIKYRKLSSDEISKKTGLSIATIKALRYGNRDISKVETKTLFKLAKVLRVKVESLLTNLELELK